MLIGISGKISSGKDTVGNIIQYIIEMNKRVKADVISFDRFMINKQVGVINYAKLSGFEIKKFADTLKDIVCMLIGCTREQLEDQQFKNAELGEEWYKYSIEESRGTIVWKILYFSTLDKANDYTKKYHRFKQEPKLVKLTPRLLLQLLGTECGRDIIHPNVWINSLFSDYKIIGIKTKVSEEHIEFLSNIKSDKFLPNVFESVYPNWIITDMRFPNEMEAIKKRAGITIRVNRFNRNETPYQIAYTKAHEHPSEKALDNANFDYVIENNGTVEELIEKVKEILINEKII